MLEFFFHSCVLFKLLPWPLCWSPRPWRHRSRRWRWKRKSRPTWPPPLESYVSTPHRHLLLRCSCRLFTKIISCLVDPSKGEVTMRVIRNPQAALSPFFFPSPFRPREQTRSKIELHPGSYIFALAPSCRSNRGGDPKMDYFR